MFQINVKTPQEIKAHLDKTVIGQEKAKKSLAVATYNHWKRLNSPELKLRKSNVMLIGPSGSGKTLLLQTLAELMGVPFHCADATSLTAAGYVGADVDSILHGIMSAAKQNKEMAECGIIFIDEFDKLKTTSGANGGKDVGGQAVQQALLKMLEGTQVEVRDESERTSFKMKTDNILFILGGAFVGLADKNNNVATEDLIGYGIIPEVLGRVPVVAQLSELTRDEMMQVLTKSKISPLKEYKTIFNSEGVELEFSDSALNRIVDKAIAKKTGNRAMRAIIEESLMEIMFDLPSMKDDVLKVLVTAESIEKTEGPRIYKNEKSKRQQRRVRNKQVNPNARNEAA